MSNIVPNVIISMPSQLFTLARKFQAASNGKIFIGKIDSDPTLPQNQVQVYVENEDGSHVPVSQPIIINAAGYPVYNGQIAKFVTVQGHSMAVYDAYGAQQFYFQNVLKYDPDQLQKRLASVADGEGDSLIGVKQPFLYSESRTQHDKNSEYLSILDFVGVKNDGITDCTDGINNAIYSLYNKGGGIIHFPPGKYLITGAIIIRRGVICKATPSTVYIQLGDEVNKGMVESYNFDKFRALKVSNIEEDEEFTQDYGFDGFIFDGNGDKQNGLSLNYGIKMYGRRITLCRCIIANVKGVGLWTSYTWTGDETYTIDKTSIPAAIDEVEIMNTYDESWIYEGPSDTPIGSVVTNECGDINNTGEIPQTSRHFPGEPVNSIVVVANRAIQADYLNINTPRFGYAFVSKENCRITIDTLITAGGWGNIEIGKNCNGVIKNCFSQANKWNWGGVNKPFITNLSNKMVFTNTIIRRASGQDVGSDGILDSGGANWCSISNLQTPEQGGHLFIADAVDIMIGQLKAVGIGLHGSDGEVSSALITTEKCDRINFTMSFSNVSLAWRNKKNNLIGNAILSGDVGSGNVFSEGLIGNPRLNKSTLMTMQAVFRDGNGDIKTNNFIGSSSVDLTSTGAKIITIAHTLWRAPLVEEIQATIRHGSFTGAGSFSPVYINSFNSSEVVFRIDVTKEASGTPVSQVVCRIN
ncbi:hypothetical protein BSY49_004384 [Salmonella enterica subsp. enterica serovar Anatum]|nr:hypothetical protein [Salmonella enterica subsp. enterica serovar Anatum]